MLDPALEFILGAMRETGFKMHTLSPEQAREVFAGTRGQGQPIELDQVHDSEIPGFARPLPIRVYRSERSGGECSALRPGVVYLHGGGWVVGNLESHDGICRRLARDSGCTVVAVDYRLAPEHPFPAGLDDADRAVGWVRSNAAQLGIDPARLAIAGDSAGGNLAAAVTLRMRDRGEAALRFQVLIYPVTDADFSLPSYSENASGYFLETDTMKWFWDHYAPDPAQRSSPQAAPLRAESLRDLPAALVLTAGFDPLRDEGEAYAARLEADGVPTRVERYPSLIHGFFSFADYVPAAAEAITQTARRLRDALAD